MWHYLLGKDSSKDFPNKIINLDSGDLILNSIEQNIAELVDIHLVVDRYHRFLIGTFYTFRKLYGTELVFLRMNHFKEKLFKLLNNWTIKLCLVVAGIRIYKCLSEWLCHEKLLKEAVHETYATRILQTFVFLLFLWLGFNTPVFIYLPVFLSLQLC